MPAFLDLQDDRTLARLDTNYLASHCALMGSSRFGEAAERSDVVLASCGAPIVRFNLAHLKPPFADLDSALDHAAGFFDRLRLPYSIEFRQGSAAERAGVEAGLRERGWIRTAAPVPGMALHPIATITAVPRSPTELAIERVEGDRAREEFVRTAASGFGFPADAGSAIFGPAFLERPEVEAYLGRVDGVPAATSMLFRSGEIAGIYWVSTLPGVRRRGLGEAITRASIAAGARAGCRVASLQASEMGRPVYSRMGFAHVIDYVRYQRPEQTDESLAP